MKSENLMVLYSEDQIYIWIGKNVGEKEGIWIGEDKNEKINGFAIAKVIDCYLKYKRFKKITWI